MAQRAATAGGLRGCGSSYFPPSSCLVNLLACCSREPGMAVAQRLPSVAAFWWPQYMIGAQCKMLARLGRSGRYRHILAAVPSALTLKLIQTVDQAPRRATPRPARQACRHAMLDQLPPPRAAPLPRSPDASPAAPETAPRFGCTPRATPVCRGPTVPQFSGTTACTASGCRRGFRGRRGSADGLQAAKPEATSV